MGLHDDVVVRYYAFLCFCYLSKISLLRMFVIYQLFVICNLFAIDENRRNGAP